MAITGYMSRLPTPPDARAVNDIVAALHQAKKPVLYVGGGCLDASEELRAFVKRTGIPVAQTLMGLGAYPETDELALQVCLFGWASLVCEGFWGGESRRGGLRDWVCLGGSKFQSKIPIQNFDK